jgi:hypothetical protein
MDTTNYEFLNFPIYRFNLGAGLKQALERRHFASDANGQAIHTVVSPQGEHPDYIQVLNVAGFRGD